MTTPSQFSRPMPRPSDSDLSDLTLGLWMAQHEAWCAVQANPRSAVAQRQHARACRRFFLRLARLEKIARHAARQRSHGKAA